jgi:hypothetical protein
LCAAHGIRPANEKLADRAEQGEFVIAHNSREFGDARPSQTASLSSYVEPGWHRDGAETADIMVFPAP